MDIRTTVIRNLSSCSVIYTVEISGGLRFLSSDEMHKLKENPTKAKLTTANERYVFSLHPRCVVTGEYCLARAPLELLVDVGWTESEGHSFDKLGLSLCRSTHQRIQRPAVCAERREFKLLDAIWPSVPGHGSDKISSACSERRNAHWVCRLPHLWAF